MDQKFYKFCKVVTPIPEPRPVTEPKQNLIKCTFFPRCKNGTKCKFFHPSEVCTYFPRCTRGELCLYLHLEPSPRIKRKYPTAVECKFGANCRNYSCKFAHTQSNGNGYGTRSAKLCLYGANCTRPNCKFVHPGGQASTAEELGSGGVEKSGEAYVKAVVNAGMGDELEREMSETRKQFKIKLDKKFKDDSTGFD